MDEEIFNQKNISTLIRNILTLRYDPSQQTTLSTLNDNDFVPSKIEIPDFVEDTLTKSIKSKLRSANNVAISLSGGVDSTLVLSFIRKIFPDLKINAVSIKFADSVDETQVAKKIADFFEAEHEIISLDNYLLELPAAINIIGLPFWDIHWYYIAKNSKPKSDFIASGDGGDEIFAGYNRHIWASANLRTGISAFDPGLGLLRKLSNRCRNSRYSALAMWSANCLPLCLR